jgi:hypothetical protein
MLDIAVPEVGLQRSRNMSLIGEGVAASVAEHVGGVGLKFQLGLGRRLARSCGQNQPW